MRGDMDKETIGKILLLADQQAGLDPESAMDDIRTAQDEATGYLNGSMFQAEQEPLTTLEPREELPKPPTQRGQRRLDEGLGAVEGVPPVPRGPMGSAPTQPHGVEGGAMRLDEGQQVFPEPEENFGRHEDLVMAAREIYPRATNILKDHIGGVIFINGGPDDGGGINIEPGDPRYEQAEAIYNEFLLRESRRGKTPTPPAATKRPAAPATEETQPTTEAPPTAERRTEPRRRDIDSAESAVFDVQRSQNLDPKLVASLVSAVKGGQSVDIAFGDPQFKGKGLTQELYDAASQLEEAVYKRSIAEQVQGEAETEIFGEEPKPPEPPPPEAKGKELEGLVKGTPPIFEAAFRTPEGEIIKTGAIHQTPVDANNQPQTDLEAGFWDAKTEEFLTREEALKRVRVKKPVSDRAKAGEGLDAVDLIHGEAERAEAAPAARAGPLTIDTAKAEKFSAAVEKRGSKGNTTTVVTPDGTMEEEVEYQLVEASDLTASQGLDLTDNPDYPRELQGRNRERGASEQQVEKIKRELDPERLAESRVSNAGAPIVGPDGLVESGNARTIAMQRMYNEKHGSVKKYRDWLVKNAQRFGLNKNKMMGMRAPVLVRVRKTAENRVEFADKSNAREVLAMAPTELATADVKRLTPDMMRFFAPSESGRIDTKENQEFVRKFLGSMSEEERGNLIGSDNQLNQEGERRIKNAILAKAYDSADLIEKIIEDTDSKIKNIGNALTMAAPQMVNVKTGIESGTIDSEFDPTPHLVQAIEKISALRAEGKNLTEWLGNQDLPFGEAVGVSPPARAFMRGMNKWARSAKNTAAFLERVFGMIEQQTGGNTVQGSLDLQIDAVTLEYLIDRAAEGEGENTLFDLSKPRKLRAPQVADVKAAFPGWSMRQVTPWLYRLSRAGQPIVHVQVTSRTLTKADIASAARNHGMTFLEAEAGIRAGEIAIKGSYSFGAVNGTHLVSLYAPHAGPETLFHEAFHFAFHNVLNADERKQLLKVYKTEEAAAGVYQKFAKGEAAKGVAQKIFHKLREFARRLLAANKVDFDAAQSLMTKIANGDAYSREARYFMGTDTTGAIPVQSFANAVLSAKEAAAEAAENAKLKIGEFPDAVAKIKKEIGHSFVDRGDHTMFDLSPTAGQPPGQHPGIFIADQTLSEYLQNHVERFLVNKLQSIRTLQEKLTGAGEQIADMFNAYLKAQNFQSRAGALLDWAEEKLFNPFVDDLAASGVKLRDFGVFRMAAHALERNIKIEESRVGVPIARAEKVIAEMSKKMLTPGVKVRDLERGNVGTVTAVDNKGGRAAVEFVNPKNKMARKTVVVPMRQIERESVARARDDIAEITRQQEAGEIPNSGISNEDAKAILEELRSLGLVDWDGQLGPNTTYRGTMGDLSKRFSDIVRWKEDILFKAGLLSEKELKKWRDYKHYTPMRGKEPDIMDIIKGGRRMPIPAIEQYGGSVWHRALSRMAQGMGIERELFTTTTGRGYNPGRRPASHRALGRRSFPQHDPVAALLQDTMEAAVRAEKNRVAKTVWNLLHQFKDATDAKGEKLFEVDVPDTRIVFDEKTGTVKTVSDGMSVMKDNVYNVWIDGKLHYLRGVSPEMAEFFSALNNVGNTEAWFKAGGAVNRYISKMATSRNPAFPLVNLPRDVGTATMKLLGDKKFKDFGSIKTLKQIPSSWGTLAEYARRQSKGTLDKMSAAKRARVERFKLAGGETAFWMIPNLPAQMRNIQAKIQAAQGKDRLAYPKAVIHCIEDYNAAIEGATRFAIFERALDLGLSEDRAGQLARDITVDFTQQGTVSRYLSGLYVFANASIQGSANMITAAKNNKKIQAMLLGAAAYGFTHAAAMRFAGGDDPEDGIAYWDKISAWEKKRNLILMLPGTKGKYFKLPLAWGYSVFPYIGTVLADTMMGPKKGGEATLDVLSAAMSSFNPIGDNDVSTLAGFYQMGSPAWADPLTDVLLNKNFWGGPIRPEPGKFERSEQYGKEAPDYNKYFSSVSDTNKWLSRVLYKHLGVDWSPENMDYTVASVFGGLGDTINRSIDLVLNVSKRRAIGFREVPILKSFLGEVPDYFAPEMYRANMGDYWLKKETFDDLKKADPKAATEFYRRHYEILSMEDLVKETEKRIREMKKSGVELRESRMQREFKLFNRRYNQVETKTMKRRIKER
ncbi:MAG TPA: LPD38 domain-containing protein [Armatimonadota bacterium]|nr:LPD38 domain-containing protein [Armatimonadota bacterium]